MIARALPGLPLVILRGDARRGIKKRRRPFRDILALVRRELWGDFDFPLSRSDPEVVLLPRATLAQVASAACY
jgi:hypothetical protein